MVNELEIAKKHINNEEFDASISVLTKLIQKDPKQYEAIKLRGLAYANIEDHKNAVKVIYKHSYGTNDFQDFSEFLKHSNKDVDSFVYRGLSFIELENYEKGIEDFNNAIELKDNDADMYFNRALAYEKVDKNDEALKDYCKTIELDPRNDEAYVNR